MASVRTNEQLLECFQNYPNLFSLKLEQILEPKQLSRELKSAYEKLKREKKSEPKDTIDEVQRDNLIAFIAMKFEKYSEARQIIESVREKDPENLIALTNQGISLVKQEKIREAKEVLQEIEKLQDEKQYGKGIINARVTIAKAELAYSYSRFGPGYHQIAIENFKEILLEAKDNTVHSNYIVMWSYRLSVVYTRCLKDQNYCEDDNFNADKYYAEVIKLLHPTVTSCELPDFKGKGWVKLAEASNAYSVIPQSLKKRNIKLPDNFSTDDCFEKAVYFAPDDHHVLERVGWYTQQSKRDYDLAISYLKRAVTKLPTACAYHHLGLAYRDKWRQENEEQRNHQGMTGTYRREKRQRYQIRGHVKGRNSSQTFRRQTGQWHPRHESYTVSTQTDHEVHEQLTECSSIPDPNTNDTNPCDQETNIFIRKHDRNEVDCDDNSIRPYKYSGHEIDGHDDKRRIQDSQCDQSSRHCDSGLDRLDQFSEKDDTSSNSDKFRRNSNSTAKQQSTPAGYQTHTTYQGRKKQFSPKPQRKHSHMMKAQNVIDRGNPLLQKAKCYLEKADELAQNGGSCILVDLARVNISLGEDFEGAMDSFCLALGPNVRNTPLDASRVYEQWGLCLIENGQVENGKNLLRKAIESAAKVKYHAIMAFPALEDILKTENETQRSDARPAKELAQLYRLIESYSESLELSEIAYHRDSSDKEIEDLLIDNLNKHGGCNSRLLGTLLKKNGYFITSEMMHCINRKAVNEQSKIALNIPRDIFQDTFAETFNLPSEEFDYDIFVMYGRHDIEFARQVLLSIIEDYLGLDCCFPDRDFEEEADFITECGNAVMKSCCMVIVVSRRFIRDYKDALPLIAEKISQRQHGQLVLCITEDDTNLPDEMKVFPIVECFHLNHVEMSVADDEKLAKLAPIRDNLFQAFTDVSYSQSCSE
ncbi:uncharacterized protein LOC144446125 [Glandiceps talaboti]